MFKNWKKKEKRIGKISIIKLYTQFKAIYRLNAIPIIIFIVVQLLGWIWLFETPWTEACQASLSFTISWSFFKLMSAESVMLSNHLTLFSSCPQPYPASGSFPGNGLFTSGGQSIGVSVSASVLPMNIHGWFPLELIGLISLLSKGLGPWATIIWGMSHHNVWFLVLLLSASLHGDLV